METPSLEQSALSDLALDQGKLDYAVSKGPC